MAYDANFPPTNAELISAEFRAQFQGLKALIDAVQAQMNGLLPVGFIGAWPKGRTNLPALPGTWVECNGQVLNDPQSPFDGQTIEDLNGVLGGPKRFLRGSAASGGTGGADTHVHDIDLQNITANTADGGDHTSVTPTVYTTTGPNPGSSALPSYYEVVWIIRIK